MSRRLWIFAVAMLMSLAAGGVAAQDASPAADAFVTPDPADCTAAPRTVDELRAFLKSPATGTPIATPDAAPEGEPANAGTVEAVTAVVNEYYACINANAFLRSFALYTDAYLANSLRDGDLNPDALDLFATPIAPQEADKRISIAVDDVTLLADGRVRVEVIERNPYADNAASTTTIILVERDGRWRIDDIVFPPAS